MHHDERRRIAAALIAAACRIPGGLRSSLGSRRRSPSACAPARNSIDPHFTATGTHAEALKHVFDTLIWSGDGLEIEPRLAESWKAVDADDVGVQAAQGRQIP